MQYSKIVIMMINANLKIDSEKKDCIMIPVNIGIVNDIEQRSITFLR